jgi:glycosyltransferase involved in cell wall biosynthesis
VGERPDLVHFHSGGLFSWGNRWPGSSWPAALRRQGIPSVWTNHLVVDWLHGYCGDRKPLWFKLAMLPLSYLGKSQQLAATSAEICVSDHDAGKIRRWYFPFSKKVKRIYHSRLAEHEIAFSPLPREKMILAVGHLAFRKGQHILVQAFAKICREHSDWKLVLIGPESADGCAGWIRSFCRKEGIEAQVEMAGPRSHPSDWMKRCSIFVQPSLQEALGLALQEAMATGCACIGTKVGGIPELIEDDRSGLLCEGGEVSQLAQALVKFMEQKELRGRCGKAALDRVRALKMNQGVMIQAHREIYAQYGAC